MNLLDRAALKAVVLAIEGLEGIRLPPKISRILDLTHDTLAGFILGVQQRNPDTQREDAAKQTPPAPAPSRGPGPVSATSPLSSGDAGMHGRCEPIPAPIPIPCLETLLGDGRRPTKQAETGDAAGQGDAHIPVKSLDPTAPIPDLPSCLDRRERAA